MKEITIKGQTSISLLERFPETPILTLAKKAYSENKETYLSVEDARSSLRYYAGKSGEKNRNSILVKDFFRKDGSLSPFKSIPKGIFELGDWKPVTVKGNKSLVVADIHTPFHDKVAVEIALEYAYKEGVDSVILLGDIVDFYSISRFIKNPKLRNFKEEVDVSKQVLAVIRDCFPDAEIIFKVGNHEERYSNYMAVKAPELFDIDNFQLSKLLELEKLNIKVVDDKRKIRIGGLNLIHGHEFGRAFSSPVNPARGYFLKGKEHCLGAHYHQPSHHSENTMDDNFIGCWSIGCLCDLRPKYLPMNKWGHGFAIVERGVGKEFQVHNKKIISGKVYSA